MKENKIIIRLDKNFSDEYFNMCENEGYTMSKRVRRMMELDIEINKLNLNSITELYKLIGDNEKK
jgi:hypothetical protein